MVRLILTDDEYKRLCDYALVGWGKNPTFSIEDTRLMVKVKEWLVRQLD